MTCSFASDEHKDTCLHSFTHVLLNLSVVVAMRLSESLFKSFIQLDQWHVSLVSFFDSYRRTFQHPLPHTGPYWDRQSAPRGVGRRAVWTPTHPGIGPVQTTSQDRYGMDAVLSMHHLCLQAPNLWGKPTNHNEWHNTLDTPWFGRTSIQNVFRIVSESTHHQW